MTDQEILYAQLMGMSDFDEVRRDVLRLPFSYPGSKLDQLDLILPHLPYRRGFGEAFGGSGVVLLNREPSKLEILNDRYMGVTALYRVVRDREKCKQLIERVEMAVHSREEFIWCQSTWKDCNDEIERAARWYYIVQHAVNSKPESTFGRATKGGAQLGRKYHNAIPLFWPLHERLRDTVQIENLDWRQCLSDFDSEDMVWYLDPTYLGTTKAYEFNMTPEEHVELCERIFNMKGFVALSGYNNHVTRSIYDSYNWTDKITWERNTECLVHCDHMLKAVETSTKRSDQTVEESLWLLSN